MNSFAHSYANCIIISVGFQSSAYCIVYCVCGYGCENVGACTWISCPDTAILIVSFIIEPHMGYIKASQTKF